MVYYPEFMSPEKYKHIKGGGGKFQNWVLRILKTRSDFIYKFSSFGNVQQTILHENNIVQTTFHLLTQANGGSYTHRIYNVCKNNNNNK